MAEKPAPQDQAYQVMDHLARVFPDSSTCTNVLRGPNVVRRLVKDGLVSVEAAGTYRLTQDGFREWTRRNELAFTGSWA